jgi:phosphoglycolate/pyridoxal phosphate phosphatase family enzyme
MTHFPLTILQPTSDMFDIIFFSNLFPVMKLVIKLSVQLGATEMLSVSRSSLCVSALMLHHRRPLPFAAGGLGRVSSLFRPQTRTYGSLMDSESFATAKMRSDAFAETRWLADFYKHKDLDKGAESKPTIWLSRTDAADFVKEEIDTVLFDCDGVLYRTQEQCPGARDCVQQLLDLGKTVLFVTNNAGVNRRELREKLVKILEIESLTIDQMVSSSYSAARFLKQGLLSGENAKGSISNSSRVHVIGSSGLCEELANCGFEITGGPSPSEPNGMTREQLANYEFSEDPIDALVVGHDTSMNFRKLCIADNLLMRNPDALFIATNRDNFDVVGTDNRHIAGNGCTVVALEYSSRRTATNVGKSSQTLFELIRKDHLDSMNVPSRCLFVGDRLDTDIRFGYDNGMKSLLVMTGVTNAEQIVNLGDGTEEEPLPDFIAPFVSMPILGG